MLPQREKSKLSKNKRKQWNIKAFSDTFFFFCLLPTASELFNLNLLIETAAHQLDSLSQCPNVCADQWSTYCIHLAKWTLQVPEGNQRRQLRTGPLRSVNMARAQFNPLNILLFADVEIHRAHNGPMQSTQIDSIISRTLISYHTALFGLFLPLDVVQIWILFTSKCPWSTVWVSMLCLYS